MLESLPGVVKEIGQLGAIISAATAIVLFVASHFRARRENLQRYTLDVLMRYSHSPELLKALDRLRARAAQADGEVIVDDQLAEDLAITMPHFSAISLATNKGLLDRDIILQARYASMRAIWASYGRHLDERSARLKRPLLYADLEEFLEANRAKYEDYARKEHDRQRALAAARDGAAPSSARGLVQ